LSKGVGCSSTSGGVILLATGFIVREVGDAVADLFKGEDAGPCEYLISSKVDLPLLGELGSVGHFTPGERGMRSSNVCKD